MLEIKKLNVALAEKHIDKLSNFYYQNISACDYLQNFTKDDAKKKIRDFISHLKEDTAIGYGCFDGEELCGFVWAYIHTFREETRVYISEIRIEEKNRGLGLGTRLIESVEKDAKKKGITALYLHAEANNQKAIELYEKCGFCLERVQMRKEIK